MGLSASPRPSRKESNWTVAGLGDPDEPNGERGELQGDAALWAPRCPLARSCTSEPGRCRSQPAAWSRVWSPTRPYAEPGGFQRHFPPHLSFLFGAHKKHPFQRQRWAENEIPAAERMDREHAGDSAAGFIPAPGGGPGSPCKSRRASASEKERIKLKGCEARLPSKRSY